VDYAGAFFLANLPGDTLRAGLNFYANGVNLNPAGLWTLQLDTDNGDALSSFAEAYNLSLSNASVAGAGWLSAAEGVTLVACSGNIDGTRKSFLMGTPGDPFAGTVTVYDDVIRIQISSGAFENSRNEISAALSSMRVDGGASVFTGAYIDPQCLTTTDGQGDLAAFYLRSSIPWNTDATGLSPGAAFSTDRDGIHRTAIPNIQAVKAAIGVYQVLRDDHKNRLTHYPLASPFAGVADACRPVLASVRAGQAAHAPNTAAPADAFDGHNYLQIAWSEPVNIGTGAGFTLADLSANNVTAQDDFANAASHGGEISQAGAELVMPGYLSVAGAMSKGSRDGDARISSLYRDPAVNDRGGHGLYVSVGGRSSISNGYRIWPGYFTALDGPRVKSLVAHTTLSSPINGETHWNLLLTILRLPGMPGAAKIPGNRDSSRVRVGCLSSGTLQGRRWELPRHPFGNRIRHRFDRSAGDRSAPRFFLRIERRGNELAWAYGCVDIQAFGS
jgi:hypothetical protein